MLDSAVKNKLLIKLENLITEKKKSEDLKKEFIDWFNSGKPFIDFMNDSEKQVLKKYPKLIIKQNIYFNLYSALRWGDGGLFKGIFESKDKELLDEDCKLGFYHFKLTTYPSIFDIDYSLNTINENNKDLSNLVVEKISNILKVRKKYLEKLYFIKRVLDSRELTKTFLKNNYKDLYDLL